MPDELLRRRASPLATDPRARDPIRNIQIVCPGNGIEPTQQALATVIIRSVKEILTNSLTTDEPVQTTALVKEFEPIVQKNMCGSLLFAVAASFFLRRRWLGPPAGSASRSLSGLGHIKVISVKSTVNG